MRSIAIINQKGGSGKTTTSVNLAATLAARDRRVLVVDMDPQASATNWFGIASPGRGVTDIIINNLALLDLVQITAIPGVALVPASAWLLGAEKGLSWNSDSLLLFQRSISDLQQGHWDYMLVDCAPSLGILTANALIGVKEVLIPVETHHLALPGVDRVMASVETVRKHLNAGLEVTGILPCRVDPRTRHSKKIVEQLRERYGSLVYKSEIRENIRLAEAPVLSMPITIFDPESTGTHDYGNLADEIIAAEMARRKK